MTWSKEGIAGLVITFLISAWFYLNDISSSQFLLLVPVSYLVGYVLGGKKSGGK